VKGEALDNVEQQNANIDVLEDARLGDEGSELPALGEDACAVVAETECADLGTAGAELGLRNSAQIEMSIGSLAEVAGVSYSTIIRHLQDSLRMKLSSAAGYHLS
jgi:hypothetical protein